VEVVLCKQQLMTGGNAAVAVSEKVVMTGL